MFEAKKQKSSLRQSNDNLNYTGIDALVDSEKGLVNYNQHIVKHLAKGLGISKNAGNSGRVFEFGAGTGALAEIWQSELNLKPICIEIDPELISTLRSKGFIVNSNLNQINMEIQYLYTSNVLEHIEDDLKALEEIWGKMVSGGTLAIYVPALPILFSDLDRSVGHFRRYTKKELIEKVKQSGFEVQSCYYNDSMGVLASFLLKIFGYRNKTGLGSKKSLYLYDSVVYPISKFFDVILFKHLIGKNLFLFAVKTSN